MDRSFKVFNADGTKNEKITRFVPLELEINRHRENWCNGYKLKQYRHIFGIWLVSQVQFRSKLGQIDNTVYKMSERV